MTKEFIQSLAASEEDYSKAISVCSAESGRVESLLKNPEGTLYFGKIKDGDEHYFPSAYFIDSDAPVFHCGCNDSNYPCRHVLMMLTAFLEEKNSYCGPAPLAAFCRFDTSPLDSILKKVDHNNITPLLNLLMEVDDLVRWLLGKGLFAVKEEQLNLLLDFGERTRNSGLNKLSGLLTGLEQALVGGKENRCVQHNLMTNPMACEISTDLMCQLQACIHHNRDFLELLYTDNLLEHNHITNFINQPWIDWNKELLQQCGLTLEDSQLIQLGFYSSGKNHSNEFSESDSLGFWYAKYQEEVFITSTRNEVSKESVSNDLELPNKVVTPELAYVIPGYFNHGICWDEFRTRYLLPEDLLALREKSALQWGPVIEKVKSNWIDPLADKHPVALLMFEKLLQDAGDLYIESSHDERLPLSSGNGEEESSVLSILKYLPFDLRERQSMLVSFHNRVEHGNGIQAKPLALVSEREVLRLIS